MQSKIHARIKSANAISCTLCAEFPSLAKIIKYVFKNTIFDHKRIFMKNTFAIEIKEMTVFRFKADILEAHFRIKDLFAQFAR
ncbi:hypothetical protein D3C87_1825260 [compost metagenome]